MKVTYIQYLFYFDNINYHQSSVSLKMPKLILTLEYVKLV